MLQNERRDLFSQTTTVFLDTRDSSYSDSVQVSALVSAYVCGSCLTVYSTVSVLIQCPGRSSPALDPLRKSPTQEPVVQVTPSTPPTASSAAPSSKPTTGPALAPAPGLGCSRSPAHNHTALTGGGQGREKVQIQDGLDSKRGET